MVCENYVYSNFCLVGWSFFMTLRGQLQTLGLIGKRGEYKKSLSMCSFDKYLKCLSLMRYFKMFNCHLIYAEFYNMG